MSALGRELVALIRAEGPISVARFMTEALAHPRHGYYMRGDPLGQEGDFITAPEVSQVFGELVGLWCAERWAAMGHPTHIKLVELGPGRGTLIADAWRAMGAQAGLHAAIELHLVEIGPALVARQRDALAHAAPPVTPAWHEHFAAVPPGPLLVIANEFFDALPVHQLQRTRAGWCERRIGASPDGERLGFALAPEPSGGRLVRADARDAPLGSVYEASLAGRALAADIGARVTEFGGAALVIDCGYTDGGPRETLQAVRRHRGHPVLEAPGSADVCALVDFAALAEAATAAGAHVHGPVEQGKFLTALGATARVAALKKRACRGQLDELDAAHARLTDPAGMGSLFKVMAITERGQPAPAGFERDG